MKKVIKILRYFTSFKLKKQPKHSLKKVNTFIDEDILNKVEGIAKIGGWELDFLNDELTWSKGVYDIYNIPKSSCLKTIDAINFYAEHERKRIEKCVSEAIELKKSFDEEFEFIDGKGNKKWVRSIGEPVTNSKGEVITLQGVFQDVTHKKETEIKLKESKRYLDLAVENSRIGIWDWYLKADVVVFSKSWANMLGLDLEATTMTLQTWQDRVHPDDINACYQLFLDYQNGNTDIYENVHRLKHEDGTWRYILSRGKFSDWNSQGKPKRFTGVHIDISERKKLQEDQNYILDNTGVGIWKWDILKDELLWDDSLYSLYRVSKNDFSGAYDAWEKTLHEDYKEKTVSLLKEAMESKEEFNATFAVKTGDGKVIYVGAKARIERDSDGNAISMTGMNWDKTDEYLSELEIRSYVRGLDKYAIISKTDKEGKLTYINEKFQEISNYSEKELIGNGYSIVNSQHHSPDFFKNMWSKIKNGETWRGEIKNKTKDGDVYWVDTAISPYIDIAGKVSGYLSFSYDITELKNIQLKLTEALNVEQMSKTILEISDKPIELSKKLEIVLSILLKDEHFLNIKSSMFVLFEKNGNDGIKVIKQAHKSTKDEPVDFLQGQFHHVSDYKTSSEFFVPQNVVQLRLSCEGDDLGYIFFELEDNKELDSYNQTFLKNIEMPISQLIKISYNKQKFNEQRKIALHNSKLASVGELAAGVGHEINNPLSVIKGYLYNLDKKIDHDLIENEYLIKTISKMSDASTRIEKIVSGLRNFSRNDNEVIEPFRVLELVNESISMIREIYAKDSVEITVENYLGELDVTVSGNRGRVQQAIMNLVANAKDATESKNDRRISVQLDFRKGFVDIAIRDNGEGIKEDVQSKIFDAFFTTKAVNKGTGIGLSLAHSIATEHKGSLVFETEIGEGTEFKLSLPAHIESQVLKVESKTQSDMPFKDFLNLNLMLVDDEENITEILSELLQDHCKTIKCFKNGEEAYNEYLENPEAYDVIVSDMQMPVMNGMELVKNIRNSNIAKQPKIIFMTGGVNVNFEDKKNEMNKLVDGYFYKPFQSDDLYKALSSVIEDEQRVA